MRLRPETAWVLWRLGQRDDERAQARRHALAAVDPFVRKRVRHELHVLTAEVGGILLGGAEETLVDRVSALVASGQDDAPTWSVGAIDAAFAELTPPKPNRRPTLWRLAALGFVAAGCVGAAWWMNRPLEALRDTRPTSAQAWSEGGRPPQPDEAESLLANSLPAYLIALDAVARDQGREPELAVSRHELLAHAERALGREGRSFVEAVVDQSEALSSNEPPAPDSYRRSIDALNQVLEEQNLGFYLDAIVLERYDRRQVLFASFAVDQVNHFRTNEGASVRALRLRRIDRLAFRRSLLGFTRRQVRDALVLEERIEQFLASQLLPSLAEGAAMPLGDDFFGERANAIGARAGAVAREEAVALSDAAALTLGRALASRKARIEAWQERFAGRLALRTPERIDIDIDTYAALEARVHRSEWREFRRAQETLEDDDVRAAYRTLEAAFSGSVERHEVQHRIDYASDTLERLPPELEALTGALRIEGFDNTRAQRSLAELSAYLAELGASPALSRTRLSLLSRHLYDQSGWGRAECYATLVIFDLLARHLELDHGPFVVRRRIDREAIADIHLRVLQRTGAELSAAANAAWSEAFGRPVATVLDANAPRAAPR